jgi:hypothetical protein
LVSKEIKKDHLLSCVEHILMEVVTGLNVSPQNVYVFLSMVPRNVNLLETRIFADIINMKSHWIRMYPESNDWCPDKNVCEHTHTHTHTHTHREDIPVETKAEI